ncbi:hypothetical protein [Bacillus licheniformis]|uniref:hypothetical protein n=1 Tax=Bacillus licheniformis TaxID=1402 RepID=UPI0009B792C2|nr:hypothetical protein [Bacillus licheniformis]ARC72607.1 hypothetical protein B37_00554 [Bacillus licheniformis]ARW56592.1 hypothetical protein S100027_04628 [Bacillus licheniformis]AXF87861.1 hypothetical protein BLDA23_06050 [Bacillus licheniformis]
MDHLKEILDRYSVEQLAEIFYFELGPYYYHKVFKALDLTDKAVKTNDFGPRETKRNIENIEIGVSVSKLEEIKKVVHKILKSVDNQKPRTEEQKLINREIREWKSLGYKVDFRVVREKGIVEAIVRNEKTLEVEYVGKAICSEEDAFDEDIGKLIAIYKANYDDWKEELIDLGYKYLFV